MPMTEFDAEAIEFEPRWYFRPKEVSEKTGMSLSEIYRAIYSGQLRAFKYREKAWLIRRKDVEEWIEGCITPNAA
jgi:excisionase family DNA binding protein